MAALTWPEVVQLDAALSAVPPLVQDLILAEVNDTVDPVVLGGETSGQFLAARAALAAHCGRLALPGEAGAPGPVASKSADGLSKSYFQVAIADSTGLGQTRWGQTFLRIVRNSAARAGLII